MKLKVYDTSNTPKTLGETGTIYISVKGMLILSKTACDFMELKKEDKVVFAQDEENPTLWYLAKTNSPDGFKIHAKDSRRFQINCLGVLRFFFKSLNTDPVASRIKLSSEAVKVNSSLYFPLLTSTLEPVDKRQSIDDNQSANSKNLLKAKEVASYYNVDVSIIYKWEKDGLLHSVPGTNRPKLYLRSDLPEISKNQRNK